MSMMLLAAFSSGGEAYTLSAGPGGTISASDGGSPYNSYVGLRFLSTGAIQKTETTDASPSWVTIGDWISDTGEITGTEQVRFTNLTNNPPTFTTLAGVEDAWVNISANPEWYYNRTGPGTGTFDCDFQVQESAGAPPATDTSSYTFTIDNVV